MIIEKEMSIAEVVHHDYSLIPIISRFGIKMGYGDKSIENVCKKHNVNIDFFLTILNTFHDCNYFPHDKISSFPVILLVEYLQQAHYDYRIYKIPEIEQLINKMPDECSIDNSTHKLFINFFLEYKNELISHMEREESKVYPYVVSLYKALETGTLNDNIKIQMENYPISKYEKEHENVEEKLFDLKNLMIKHLPTVENDRLCFKILRELFFFEKELNEHARIEDAILIPKAELLETELKNLIY